LPSPVSRHTKPSDAVERADEIGVDRVVDRAPEARDIKFRQMPAGHVSPPVFATAALSQPEHVGPQRRMQGHDVYCETEAGGHGGHNCNMVVTMA
jgi:hypothetical protein